jgi:hypothetical protein
MTTVQDLIEIHDIEQVKYRYMRAVDTHQWDLMLTCFSEDARAWYNGGKYSTEGGGAGIVKLLSEMITNGFVSSHIALHPEITLTGPTTATGIWRFQDIVHCAEKTKIHEVGELLTGAGYYYDEYRKDANGWRISSTGYERIFEALENRSVDKTFHLKPFPNFGVHRA